MTAGDSKDVQATANLSLPDLTLQLTQLGLSAADLGSAMTPVLEALVTRTAAIGSGYFQLREQTLAYHARAASGEMPQGAMMDALLAHGLPADLPLIQALNSARTVLFFEDTSSAPAAAGFPDLGVHALIAAPIRGRDDRLVGALLAHVFTPHDWTQEERALVSRVTSLLALLAARLDAEEREREAHESALRALGLCLEARDAETQGHTDRVTNLAVLIGQKLRLSDADLRSLRWGAYLHDIGKMGIPDSVLHYPGQLSAESWTQMQGHVGHGVALAQQLPFLPAAALDVIAGHHERWDGAGYPNQQHGENIPLSARIFAVCDVYDALLHVRPYKPAWSEEETVKHIRASGGSHFDPKMVQALLDVLAEQSGGAQAH